MARDILQVEIKRIPLEVKTSGPGGVKLTKLAALVERYMLEMQADGEIDILKQALQATQNYYVRDFNSCLSEFSRSSYTVYSKNWPNGQKLKKHP